MAEADRAIERRIGALEPRARVALAVAAAQGALPALSPLPDAHRLAVHGLERVSAWVDGAELDGRALYAPIPELLEQEANARDSTEAALFAALAALYHGTWTAARLDPAPPPLPSDVAEIGDGYVARAIDYAVAAASDPEAERRRLMAVADRLAGAT